MKTIKNGLLIILIGLIAVGCAPSMSGNTYSRDQARKVQTVHDGEVIMVREVLIEGTKSGFGGLAGGIMGFALAAQLALVRVEVWPGRPVQSLAAQQALL